MDFFNKYPSMHSAKPQAIAARPDLEYSQIINRHYSELQKNNLTIEKCYRCTGKEGSCMYIILRDLGV